VFPLRDDPMTNQRSILPPTYRVALYWAPTAGSPLAELGAAWLGRDITDAAVTPRAALSGFSDERLTQLTKAPRHYGLHATLKPPFGFADGFDLRQLETELAVATEDMVAFPLPPLRLTWLDGFLALTPAAASPALDALAAACVQSFDHFRRSASAAELTRRRATGLSARQDAYLLRWGYPYVFEDFRFHVTLTGRIAQAEAEQLMPQLSDLFASVLGTEIAINEITLFGQAAADASFQQIRRFRFGKSA